MTPFSLGMVSKLNRLRERLSYSLLISHLGKNVTRDNIIRFFDPNSTLNDIHVEMNNEGNRDGQHLVTNTAIVTLTERQDAVSCVKKHKNVRNTLPELRKQK